MKTLMNSVVAAVGTIFFFMIATSLLLAQMGEAADGEKGKKPEKTDKVHNLEEFLRKKEINVIYPFLIG